MKYDIDQWVLYKPFIDCESDLLKETSDKALILHVYPKNDFYDYEIYIEDTGKKKKCKRTSTFSYNAPYVIVGMANNILKTALLLLVSMIAGCTGGIDYVIHGDGPGDPVYVEVEVPTYILVEVPTGIEYGEIWVDSFIQPLSVDGVDILWIIDTSGSMNAYDPRLIAGIEAMMNALPETGWRLAMLSSDPAKAVKEAQFPLIPGDDVADALNMYNAMLRGGREEGFDAAYEYIVNNTYASTWMRLDAALLIVFVSDEEEQSDDHFVNLLDFTNWYGGLRNGSTYLASINNVAKADSVCVKSPSSLDIGHRYMDAVNHFGGHHSGHLLGRLVSRRHRRFYAHRTL